MKKSRFLFPVLAVVLGMLILNPAFGASKKKPPPPPQGAVISSVTANSITVTEEKTSKTVAITQFTEITVNGQRATAGDLKTGMHVTLALGTDPTKASRIIATGK
jgi:hypothetical protein